MRFLLDRYSGFLAVSIEWIGLITCLLLQPLNLNEPASQYGYYSSTKVVFGTTLTLASILIIFFARHLARYWHYATLPALVAGLSFSLTGWVPYQPNVQTLIFDFHNLCIIVTALAYLVLVLALARQKQDVTIARISGFFSAWLVIGVIVNTYSRIAGGTILFQQLFLLFGCQLWLLLVNFYVIKDEPTANKITL